MTQQQSNRNLPGGGMSRWRACAAQRRWLKGAGLGVLLALCGPPGTAVLAQSPFPLAYDLLQGYPMALVGPTVFSVDTHAGSGYSIDFGVNGGAAVVTNASFLNLAASNDVMTFSFWLKRYDANTAGAFWGVSPSSALAGADVPVGFSAWLPFADSIYFDTDGCCDSSLMRIYASITTFPGYQAVGNDSWWTNWHQFVFFMDHGDKQIWIDAQLFLEGSSSNALPTDFTELWLATYDAPAGGLHGLMDDFTVYSTALSANNINLLFTGTSPTNLPGEKVLAYWNFDNPPEIGGLVGAYNGFSFTLFDTATRVADTSTIALTLDGQAVTPTSLATNGATITVQYVLPNPPFLPGSTQTVSIALNDTKGNSYSSSNSFVVQQFTLVPTNQLLGAGAAPTRGFKMETYQVDDVVPGNLADANAVLSGVYGPNVAAKSDPTAGAVDANGFFTWTNVVNFDNGVASNDGDFVPPNYNQFSFPGIPGILSSGSTNNPVENFVCQFYTALSFPSNGLYTMGVASADGFRVSLGLNPYDAFSSTNLGQYDGTRTWADTDFQFYIPQPGLYPFRLLYQEVSDDALLEWFMINSQGVRVLINDLTNAIPAYQWVPDLTVASVSSITPAAGDSSAVPNLVSAVIVDGTEPVSTNTVKLQIDGKAVTASVSKTGGQTTVTYVPSPSFAELSQHTATLSYQYGANTPSYSWTFTVAIYAADKLHQYVGLLIGPAVYTPNGGGHTGKAGDYAIDLGKSSVAYVEVPDGSFLNLASSNDVMTFSIWMKRYAPVNSAGIFTAVSPSAALGYGFSAWCPWSDDKIYFDTDGCCDASAMRIYASINTFPAYEAVGNDSWWTNWHHFVFFMNNSDKQIWIDGQMFLEGTSQNPLPTDYTSIWLGTYGPNNGDSLNGLVDDFAVYSTALDATDIAALFNGTAPDAISAKASLLAYWPFDDAPAPVAKPTIGIALVKGKVVITYTGTLQSSTTVNGTYSAVAGATSPYTPSGTGPSMFYRAQQ